VQILLVVGAGIEIHGQQVLRRHARTGGVELQLADGDAGAVSAEIAEAKHVRPPSVTQMNRTSFCGQFLRTFFTLPRRVVDRYMPRVWR
jgi:hypothetical protein